ncbi:hypothetical protein ACFS32_19515 [Novosphingobium pokkalii]|uniref:hypothetical protein n=1 Tax=Novosphingobium pokkalii TaxID=1770194 RepID=UPI003637F1E6
MVTRNGQDLPIGSVPSLAEGDTLKISAALPGDQGAHLMVVSAFLRGATNPRRANGSAWPAPGRTRPASIRST